MSHAQPLYQWTDRVQRLFPDLHPHHQRSLAWYSFAAALARHCGLTQVVAFLAGWLAVKAAALRARLRELYLPGAAQRGSARSTFDYTLCFGPLLRWAAAAQPDRRLLLALDPTCLTDRFRVLAVSVLYQGGGLPVAWAVQTAAQKGSWNALWKDLLGRLRQALGAGWTVLVLTDRGLESQELFEAIVALGWHPLMRVKGGGKFQPAGWHRGYRFKGFAAAAGRRWAGAGRAYPTGERLACTLLALWEPGHQEAWLLLTDLPAAAANPAWYAWRMWIEHGFRVTKRGCWQWQQTRMTDPERAARLWAVLALATLWLVEIGGQGQPLRLPALPTGRPAESAEAGPAGRRPGVRPRGRTERLVKVGLRRLLLALFSGAGLPQGQLQPQPEWPPRDWQPDPLIETMMDQS
jgi:Transposase DDE domain